MKIVFLITRNNFYRYFTPVIKEALRRGYTVECWHNYFTQPKKGPKSFTFPYLEDSPNFSGHRVTKRIFNSDKELFAMLFADNSIDVVCSVNRPNGKSLDREVKMFSFVWAVLMTGADSFVEIGNFDCADHPRKIKEVFFLFSEYWLNKGVDFVNKFYPEKSYFLDNKYARCLAIGNPEYDIFKEIIDKEEVRRKYDIPSGKSILLYLPFPYDVDYVRGEAWRRAFCGILTNTAQTKDGVYIHNKKKTFFRNILHKAHCMRRIVFDLQARDMWARGINEARLFLSVRKFCDNNDLCLVVKPRFKFSVAEYIKKTADCIVWDDEKQNDPPMLKELLSLSRLTISYYSHSVLPSVFAKAYHLNVHLPEIVFVSDAQRYLFRDDEDSMFDFSGVCQSWSIEKMIKLLPGCHIDEFTMDEARLRLYTERYLGFSDCNSSGRFFDILERQLLGQRDMETELRGL